VESYYRSFGVRAVTIRPFNTYGPGQSARAVIPTIITQALTKQTVYLGNLDALRDFTYVDDTVDAFIKAGQTDGIDGETFNLGSVLKSAFGTWLLTFLISSAPHLKLRSMTSASAQPFLKCNGC